MSEGRFYYRNPEVCAITRYEAYVFIRPGKSPLVLSPIETDEVSQLLAALSSPAPRQAILELVEEDTLAMLVGEQIVLEGAQEELSKLAPRVEPEQAIRPCRKLVFGFTGAIGTLELILPVFALARDFCEQLEVVLTESAQKLVRPDVFRFLGTRVWTNAFEPQAGINVPHIYLAETADLIVIMPASAHTLHKLAHGACSDLLSLTVAAARVPVVVVPSMNEAMWAHPAIARNVARLRADGIYVVEPTLSYKVSKSHFRETEREGGSGRGVGIRPQLLGYTLESILAVHRSSATDEIDAGR